MRAIVRVGDKNNAGGSVISGDNSLRVNGRAVAVDGSPVTGHPPYKGPHAHAHCVASVSSIRVAGKKLIFVGDQDSCGHTRSEGSPDTGH